MLKTIILNAGHSLSDPGTITKYGKEADFNRKIRDALVPLLEMNGFLVVQVPDVLGLVSSIDWVNERVKGLDDGLALSIHCNCCGGNGAETFYYKNNGKSKEIATKLINGYCEYTGLRNRGAKSDTSTRFGKLGWIRKTNCWALLLEAGFLDNKEDVEVLKDYKRVAKGICKGVCAIFGEKEKTPSFGRKKEIKEQIIKLLEEL